MSRVWREVLRPLVNFRLCGSTLPCPLPGLPLLPPLHLPTPGTKDSEGKGEEAAMEVGLGDNAHSLPASNLVDCFDLACVQDR